MTLTLIGLGLNLKSITVEALEAIKKCKQVYLETYTVRFPYTIKQLEKTIGKKIIPAPRKLVESEELIKQAKKQNIALLTYGSPFAATTHISLILTCKKNKTPCTIIQNTGIFEAISETGLQLYKFGKTTSLPAWKPNYKPCSFTNIIKQNQKINAHTLLLIDPELNLKQTIEQLEHCGVKDKIILASQLGTDKRKIYYDTPKKLRGKIVKHPFCIVIPSKMHFVEEEALEFLKQKS